MAMAITGTWAKCYSSRCGVSLPLHKFAERLGFKLPDYVLEAASRVVQREVAREIPAYRLLAYPAPYAAMRARGIPDSETDSWQVRLDTRKSAGTLLIPCHDEEGRITGCAWRYISGTRRYVNLPGMDRQSMLYGLHRVPPEHDNLILVEGFADAWKCWATGHPAVSTYGATMSQGQVQLLADRGHRRVLLMYDNDEAGYVGAARAYKMLSDHVEVRFAMRYLGVWPKDPGDANKVVISRLIAESLSFQELQAQRRKARKFNSFAIPSKLLEQGEE